MLCYGDNGKTIDEFTEMTGIPKPYLEFDLDWLVDREFLLLENKKYITNFGIKDRQHFYNVRDIYIKYKDKYYKKIIDYFNSHEQDIRNIGFYGCDFDWNKLLWTILTLYLQYFSNSELLQSIKLPDYSDEYDLHKDGGHYIINGFNESENQGVDLSKGGVITEPIFEPEKWEKVNGIWCSSVGNNYSIFTSDEKPEENYATYWLGIYIFGGSPSIITKSSRDYQIFWKKLLAFLLNNNFIMETWFTDDSGKELLATAVKENIIQKDGDKYIPKFTIFTFEQFKKLHADIFEPLVQLIKPQTLELIEIFKELNARDLPRKIQSYIKKWTYFDIWDSGIKNFMFAADDGYLYMPETPEDGTALTLSFVY